MYDVYQFYYDSDTNIFYDENGETIYNVFKYVSPDMVFLLKTMKHDLFVYGTNGDYIELVYKTNNEIH